VTNGQYRRCVAAGACDPPQPNYSATRDAYYEDGAYDDYPVLHVDWQQAAGFCAWAAAQLPTEAQWEYAARGPEGHSYPWGEELPDCDRANHVGCVGDTSRVGEYPAGASWVGALDLAGNVWEWVADWYEADYYSHSPARNPTGPSETPFKVLRGGSWNENVIVVRGADRLRHEPGGTSLSIGFRCARGSE
jgi:formylglycine-generating enzyme required for sulfatase activity